MLEYETFENMIVITGCSKDEINLVIPSNIDGKAVCQIKENSFINNNYLESIVIPGSVKVIGGYAFSSCKKLKYINLEEGVETIEDWAFISSPIETINLPKSIRNIGTNAFLGTPIRKTIEDYVSHSGFKKPKYKTNNKACVLPLVLMGDKVAIDNLYISSKSKYIDSQFELVEKGELSLKDLDIPLLFDQDEILVALFNKKPLEDLSIELSSESKTNIGNYLESDSDYIILKFNIYTKGQFISSFLVKTLYLENAILTINSMEKLEHDDMYYYFMSIKCNLECYGTGALNKQFSFNIFDDFLGKYEAQNRNGILKDESFLNMKEIVLNKKRNIIDGFVSQISGAPYFTYLYKIYSKFKDDKNYDTSTINDEFNSYLDSIYDALSDYDSLYNLVFDNNDLIEYLEAKSNHKISELANMYEIELVDDKNELVDITSLDKYKEEFINNNDNYKFFAEMFNYEMKELRRLNRQFSVLTYSE